MVWPRERQGRGLPDSRAVALSFDSRIDQLAIGLQQDSRAEIAVAIPLVARTRRQIAGTLDVLVRPVQLGAVVMALSPFLGRHRGHGLQLGLDRAMLRVEMSQVRNGILDDEHMRQRTDLYVTLHVIHALGAGKRIGAVDVHGAEPANALALGTAQC